MRLEFARRTNFITKHLIHSLNLLFSSSNWNISITKVSYWQSCRGDRLQWINSLLSVFTVGCWFLAIGQQVAWFSFSAFDSIISQAIPMHLYPILVWWASIKFQIERVIDIYLTKSKTTIIPMEMKCDWSDNAFATHFHCTYHVLLLRLFNHSTHACVSIGNIHLTAI